MIDFLLMINILLPMLYAIRKAIIKGRVRIDHVVCFSFGFLYYWVLPIAFFRYFPSINDTYYQSMIDMFKVIKRKELCFYLISIFLIYCAFMAGTSIKWEINIKIRKMPKFRMEKVCFVILLFLLLFVIFKNSNILFRGYLTEGERSFAGMFSAVFLMICSGNLLHITYTSERKFGLGLKSPWFILFILAAIILLSTGGRLYVVSGTIAFICLCTTFYNPIKMNNLIKLAAFGMISMAVLGYLRIGGSGKSGLEILSNSIYYLVAEPIYTSYSLVKYLSSYHISLLRAPITLLSGFLNILPTIILPNKADYMVSYKDLGYLVDAPLGALCSFTSLNIDFGLIGSMIFIFFLSRYFNIIRKKEGRLWRVVYVMMCSGMMFTFFRDPFTVSIVKYMFEYSFLIPWVFNFMYAKRKKESHAFCEYETIRYK